MIVENQSDKNKVSNDIINHKAIGIENAKEVSD